MSVCAISLAVYVTALVALTAGWARSLRCAAPRGPIGRCFARLLEHCARKGAGRRTRRDAQGLAGATLWTSCVAAHSLTLLLWASVPLTLERLGVGAIAVGVLCAMLSVAPALLVTLVVAVRLGWVRPDDDSGGGAGDEPDDEPDGPRGGLRREFDFLPSSDPWSHRLRAQRTRPASRPVRRPHRPARPRVPAGRERIEPGQRR